MSYYLNERKKRTEKIKNIIKEMKSDIHSKVTSRISLETGLRQEKVGEYLIILKDAGFIEIKEGKVTWIGEKDV